MRSAHAARCCVLCYFLGCVFIDMVTAWETNGQEFWFIIPSDGSSTVQSTVTVLGAEGTSVKLSTRAPVRGSSNIIDSNGVLQMSLNVWQHDDIVHGISSYKGLYITTNASCSVNVFVKGIDFALSFMTYPKATTFNIEYIVITSCHENITCDTTVAILAETTSPSVSMNFRSTSPVKMNGQTYNSGATVSMYMLAYQVIMFTSKGDLTGSKITSPLPLQVFSGSFCEKIEEVYECDISFEQLPATNSWGSEYILSPVPFPMVGLYKIAVGTSDTRVSIKERETLLIKKQEHLFLDSSNGTVVINSSFPVLVTLLLRDVESSPKYSSAMIIRQPLTQWQQSYRVISHADLENFVQVEAFLDFRDTGWVDKRLICNTNMTEHIYAEDGIIYTIPVQNDVISIGCLPACSPYDVFEYATANGVIAGSGPARNTVTVVPEFSEECPHPKEPEVETSVDIIASLSDMVTSGITDIPLFVTTELGQGGTVSSTIQHVSDNLNTLALSSSSDVIITDSSFSNNDEFLQTLSADFTETINNEAMTTSHRSRDDYLSESNYVNRDSSIFHSWLNTPTCNEPTTNCPDAETKWISYETNSDALRSSEQMTSGDQSSVAASSHSLGSTISSFERRRDFSRSPSGGPEPSNDNVNSQSNVFSSGQENPKDIKPTASIFDTKLNEDSSLVLTEMSLSGHFSRASISLFNSPMPLSPSASDKFLHTLSDILRTESSPTDVFSPTLNSRIHTSVGIEATTNLANVDSVITDVNSFLLSSSSQTLEGHLVSSYNRILTISKTSSQGLESKRATFHRDHVLCTCPCLLKDGEDWQKSLNPLMESVRQRLLLDKDTLSSEIRKRTSAYDPRASATNLGAFGTAVLAFVLGCIFGSDLIVLLKNIIVYCSRHSR